ncbi:hypothetical protein [Marinisporobacter balticus]|uniref:Aspartate racemase n=1 Tax=Marinisporobacter balticus TaxID=2018667 RepID=A0A4R2K899_9FIRM|nr:hypothetical protein [Marinisporobacter balticus]TCO68302.1 hypothetical protein EV214_14514 [Marinisporobacter balticus]
MNGSLIGILAGMGPRSTAPFLDLVIDECQLQYGAKYDEEFPHMYDGIFLTYTILY